MTRKLLLPPHLENRPFSVAEAREAGVTPSRLRAKDLRAPTRGVRRVIDGETREQVDADDTPSQRMRHLRFLLLEDMRDIAPALTEGQFFSHSSGLAAIGTPLPYTRAHRWDVHVSARRPLAQPQRRGVVGHRLQRRDAARGTARGLPVEDPARMWRQAAASWDIDDLIIAGDHLIHPRNRLSTLEALRAELDEAGDVRGRLSRALDEMRVGSESPEETRLRLLLTRAGLPEPQLNVSVSDRRGLFVARLDLAYPKYRVAPEYDGRGHASHEQFAHDADRWDAIRASGWHLVRILSHHLRPDPQIAIDKVADALLAAGWRPGRD